MEHYSQDISPDERTRAVTYVRKELSPNLINTIKEGLKREPNFLQSQHFGLGVSIRNLLRVGGFKWDDLTLDQQWRGIVSEAIKD